MASPKFVVKKILKTIPPHKLKAINQLKYRAYIFTSYLADEILGIHYSLIHPESVPIASAYYHLVMLLLGHHHPDRDSLHQQGHF